MTFPGTAMNFIFAIYIFISYQYDNNMWNRENSSLFILINDDAVISQTVTEEQSNKNKQDKLRLQM